MFGNVLEILNPETNAALAGVWLFAALAGLGLIVGILTGIFGVGGGFLIVPLLHVLFGFHYNIAVGSDLCYAIGAGATGAARHMRLRNVDLRSMLILAAGAVVGAVVGATLLSHLKETLGAGGSENFNRVMDVLFVVLLIVTAFLVFRGSVGEGGGKSLLQRLRVPPYVDLPAAGRKSVSLPGLLTVGLFVGVLSGLMGIGGGVLLVPMLLLVVGLTAHQAVGTSLGVVLFSSMAGTIKHGLTGNVNLMVAMSLLVGSTIGVQIGAWICQRLHPASLRRYFAILVLLVAAALAWQLISSLL